jgi:branched-chain amino acid aminotransferase
MQTLMQIPVQKTSHSRLSQTDFKNLEFGKYIADHMFTATWNHGTWENSGIEPYAPISVSPAALGLHYGQTVFEGMKAYRMQNGDISIFRLERHSQRFNKSLERMSMAPVPLELFKESLLTLISLDSEWVPREEGSSLYIRPFCFASEERLGMKVSDEYKFMIINSPVGPYYAKPLKVKVEKHFVRAAEGGTGYAKCGGNYGGAFYPAAQAKKEGFDQIIWTHACGHETIEEAGTMNMMFVLDGKLITPPTSSSVLDGITRDSLLTLAGRLGIPQEVRPVTVSEIRDGLENGKLQEAFGAGTAAVVAPISHISIDDTLYEISGSQENAISLNLKKALTDIRTGKAEDFAGWNTILKA